MVEIIEVRHSEAWSCAVTAGNGSWMDFWTKYDAFPGKGHGGMTFADQAPSNAKAIIKRFEVFTEPTHVPRADLQIAKAKSSGGVSWTANHGLWTTKEAATGQMVVEVDPLGIFAASSSTATTNVSTYNIAPGPDGSSAP